MINYQMRADEAVARLKEQLAAIDIEKVDKDKTLKKTVKSELNTVKKTVQQAAKTAIPNDHAGAWKGVKGMAYKKVTGGNVSILQMKGGVTLNMSIYNRPHTRYTSDRTRKLQSYWGASRNFILRFINQGTVTRTANGKGGNGNRGMITAKRWFRPAAETAMNNAADRIREVYAAVMEKEFNK